MSEEAKVMGTALKLSMNQIIADMTKIIALNPDVEIKRLAAISINHFEKGCVMAIKALFTEGIILRQAPGPNQGK